MSEEFVKSHYEWDDEKEAYVFTTREDIADRGPCMVRPDSINQKEIVECCVNLLHDATHHLSKATHGHSTTDDNIEIEMVHQISGIADLLQYIVNSTSWQEGDYYYEFDKIEIKQRLESLKFYSR
jgi:hypothetical protein